MSPARLLAKSLTDCETRGEWERKARPSLVGCGGGYEYTNEKRDITVSRHWYTGGFSYRETLTTPFSLTAAEENVVKDALKAFDDRERLCREAEALGRLIAPREGLKPDRGETGTGSTAKPRKPGPKGAPKGTSHEPRS